MGAVSESNEGRGAPRFSRTESGEWEARRVDVADGPEEQDEPGAGDGSVAPDASSATEDAATDSSDVPRRSGRRRPRTPRVWLQGSTTTQHWDEVMVGWAVVALGAGVLVATAAVQLIGGAVGGWLGTAALWVAMIVPVVLAFRTSVPRGLLRLRGTDVLFGLVFGVLLRIVSGWLEQAASGVAVWPSYPLANGALAGHWWFTDLVVPVAIAPLVEEFFFHGLLLVALYTVFRRLTRAPAIAGTAAALVSTGLFVLLHQLTGSLGSSWASPASLALVGLVGAVLVLVTGRLWSAVLAHIVFNATFVALALVGTLTAGAGGSTGLS